MRLFGIATVKAGIAQVEPVRGLNRLEPGQLHEGLPRLIRTVLGQQAGRQQLPGIRGVLHSCGQCIADQPLGLHRLAAVQHPCGGSETCGHEGFHDGDRGRIATAGVRESARNGNRVAGAGTSRTRQESED